MLSIRKPISKSCLKIEKLKIIIKLYLDTFNMTLVKKFCLKSKKIKNCYAQLLHHVNCKKCYHCILTIKTLAIRYNSNIQTK